METVKPGYQDRSTNPDLPLHSFNQLFRVISHPTFEDRFDVFDVVNIRSWIALDEDHVCLLSGSECPNAVVPAQVQRPILSRDLNRFDRSKACFDQKLDFALIPKARQYATVSSRIGACEQQSPGLDKRALEVKLLAELSSRRGVEG